MKKLRRGEAFLFSEAHAGTRQRPVAPTRPIGPAFEVLPQSGQTLCSWAEPKTKRDRRSDPFVFWCPRRDSNPHTSRHMDLNHARLPIPPRGPGLAIIARRCRRIPLRYQALPICARPTFVWFLRRPHPSQHPRFWLCRLRRERKYSG